VTRLHLTVAAALVACVVAIGVSIVVISVTDARGDQSPIAGDPRIYEQRVDAILDGGTPYVDATLEHLPISVIPMIAVSGLARASGIDYVFLWAVSMSLVFIATVWVWASQPLPFDAGGRFLIVGLPLLPLVLYRVEPWVVLGVTIAIVMARHRRWVGSSVMTVAATLAKGWPIVLFAYPWRGGHRRLAVVSASVSVIVLGVIAALPGFREGRAFTGIHTETVVGNLILVMRHATGSALGVDMTAGAAYVSVPTAAIAINVAIGGWFLLRGAIPAMRTYAIERLEVPLGLAVAGILLGSPLLSAQFVYWLTPFVIFLGITNRRVFIVIGILSTLSMVWWDPASALWAVTILARNILLLALAVCWYRGLRNGRATVMPDGAEQVAHG
jgi:hypothetical protein